MAKNKTIPTAYFTGSEDYNPGVAWSNQENVLYIFTNRRTKKVTISDSFNIKIETMRFDEAPLIVENYGRFGGEWFSSDSEWGSNLPQDKYKDLEVETYPGLGNELVITQGKKDVLHFTVTLGLLHISGFDYLDNPSFIHEGKECVFESGDSIYLMDISKHEIGKITDGNTYILFSKKFSIENYWKENTSPYIN
jgi:hypothetical protein